MTDSSPSGRPSFPPFLRTPLIGREHDAATVIGLLQRDDVPLVTLTGPAGVGKTSLALHVAVSVAFAFADGVCFVDLSPLRDPDEVLPAVARAVGLTDKGAQSIAEQLIGNLAARQFLLVLDNVEQVVESAPAIADLLTRCPDLKILATSRVVLRLSFEHELSIAPLPIPDAVRLFAQRVQRSIPGFTLAENNAATVEAICSRLDGLPLAIELAAARVAVLPTRALLVRLERALPLLTGGARDQPDRLRTMRDAIAWSHDLLKPAEQVLFRRLAVFAGGFVLTGVEAVASLGVGGLDAIDGIASLVEKSIVQQVGGPDAEEPHYRMLETVREFGLERLAGSGEEATVRGAHAAYVLAVAEANIERLFTPEFDRVAARLDTELDNVRAALAWLDEAGESEAGLRLAAAMFLYWMVRGTFREGHRLLERALARSDQAATPARAMALTGAGWLAYQHGDRAAAAALETEGLAVARAAGDRVVEAVALAFLGSVDLDRGEYERAILEMEAALALHLELESEPAGVHRHLWTSGLPTQAASLCGNLVQAALALDDIAAAERHLAEARRRHQALGSGWGIGYLARCQGDLARARGDQDGALAAYRESLEHARDRRERRFLPEAMAGIAGIVVARGQPERATRLLAVAAVLREQIGAPQGWGRRVHESAEAAARAALPPEAFAAAWAAGSALSVEEAITDALQAADPAGFIAPTTTVPDPAVAAGLTAREAEVLRLLAQGLKDREIGEALSISPHTVHGHVTHLLTKLDLDSRTAAAAFAVRHGLA